ncbi:MAG: PorP/SprF family type IX secretion system membrane protein [bacterium]|nr:PorP/SprF family type IX secretion system membrane protein [bacterium]
MKKFVLLSCASIFLTLVSFAQDPILLNNNQSLVYFNPSFAGSNGGIRNQFSYRNQWPEYHTNYVTYVNSFDAYIRPIKAGLAFTYVNDNVWHGDLITSLYNLSYAQHLNFFNDKLKIIPSVQFSYGQKVLNMNSIHFGDMLDARTSQWWDTKEAIPSSTKSYFDMSTGLLVNFKSNWYLGACMFHINQPDVGLEGAHTLPARFLLHASYTWHFSEKSQLQFFYRYARQDNYGTNQLSLNMVTFKYLLVGVSYFDADALQINLGARTNNFSLQVGYDYTYSKLAGNTVGSWEVHGAYYLRNKENRKLLTNFETW